MTTDETTIRTPREGDCAVLDEPGGWRVLCHRRLPGNRFCRRVVALIELAPDKAGRTRRMVRFISVGWAHHGLAPHRSVWRLNTSDKERLKDGLRPRRLASGVTQHLWDTGQRAADGAYILDGADVVRPRLPTQIECPWCGHNRTLDATRLEALGADHDPKTQYLDGEERP